MGRLLAGLGGAFGLAALWRFLRRAPAPQTTGVDPAEELRVQARAGTRSRRRPRRVRRRGGSAGRRGRAAPLDRGAPAGDPRQGAAGTRRDARLRARRLRKPALSRLLRARGILQGDEKAAAGRRAAARRGGVRPRTSRGGLRSLRRSRARARVGRVRAARRAEGDPRRANRTRTLRGRGLAGRERACEHRPRSVSRLGGRRAAALCAPSRTVPRLVLEGAFLLLVAVLAGLADLVRRVDRARDGDRVGTRRPHRVGRRREALPLASRRDRSARRCRARSRRPTRPGRGTCRWSRRRSSRAARTPSRRRSSPSSPSSRRSFPSPSPSRRRSAGDCSAAASPPRRVLPILPAIPGRRSLAAAVAAAFLVTVPAPRRLRTPPGAGAEGLLRPHGRGLRDRAEASDRARVRPGRSSLRDAGERRGRRSRPGLLEAARPRPRLQDAARPACGRARRSSSRRRARCSRLTVAGKRVVSRKTIVNAPPVRPASAGHGRPRPRRPPLPRQRHDLRRLPREGSPQRRDPLLQARRQRPADRGDRAPQSVRARLRRRHALRLRQRPRRPRQERAGRDDRADQARRRLRLAALLGELAAQEARGLVPRRHAAGRLPRAALVGGLARTLGRNDDRGRVGPVPERALGPEARPGQRQDRPLLDVRRRLRAPARPRRRAQTAASSRATGAAA